LYRFIIDLGFQKFRTKKLQNALTFDRELELRCSKNESCSKWLNQICGQSQRRFKIQNFSKIPLFTICFFMF